jgi:hypothetical protein
VAGADSPLWFLYPPPAPRGTDTALGAATAKRAKLDMEEEVHAAGAGSGFNFTACTSRQLSPLCDMQAGTAPPGAGRRCLEHHSHLRRLHTEVAWTFYLRTMLKSYPRPSFRRGREGDGSCHLNWELSHLSSNSQSTPHQIAHHPSCGPSAGFSASAGCAAGPAKPRPPVPLLEM